MSQIQDLLSRAVEENIIDEKQHDQMLDLLAGEASSTELKSTGTSTSGDGWTLDSISNDQAYSPNEASEMPRLVRGFHDVLISIGVIAALGGLWGLGGPIPVVVACWALCEYFVRKKNLALPAFILSIVYASSASHLIAASVSSFLGAGNGPERGVVISLGLLACLIPFYFRFRIPVSLAFLILGCAGLAFMIIGTLIGVLTGVNIFGTGSTGTAGAIGAALAIVLFLIAMWFDMKDLHRKTRNSDVAFWLHLLTAPLLLYSVLSALFLGGIGFANRNPELPQIAGVLAIVVLLMIIGIVIDRRAFVTSGLISLGAAIYYFAQLLDIQLTQLGALSFLLVGMIVLTLGSAWQLMRRVLVSRLPAGIRNRVPPLAEA